MIDISVKNFGKYLTTVFNKFNPKNIQVDEPYRKVIKDVSSFDYYMDTQATFEIVNGYEKDQLKLFNEIPVKAAVSKKSNSQYKIYKGILYRYSDHWGNVASCVWNLEDEYDGFVLASVPLKEMQPKQNKFNYVMYRQNTIEKLETWKNKFIDYIEDNFNFIDKSINYVHDFINDFDEKIDYADMLIKKKIVNKTLLK